MPWCVDWTYDIYSDIYNVQLAQLGMRYVGYVALACDMDLHTACRV